MIIYDKNNDKTFKNISIFLTVDEAKHLRDSINSLLREPVKPGNHIKVNNDKLTKAISVAVYPIDQNLDGFDEETKRLIEQEE
jgi:hypothetical protein